MFTHYTINVIIFGKETKKDPDTRVGGVPTRDSITFVSGLPADDPPVRKRVVPKDL